MTGRASSLMVVSSAVLFITSSTVARGLLAVPFISSSSEGSSDRADGGGSSGSQQRHMAESIEALMQCGDATASVIWGEELMRHSSDAVLSVEDTLRWMPYDLWPAAAEFASAAITDLEKSKIIQARYIGRSHTLLLPINPGVEIGVSSASCELSDSAISSVAVTVQVKKKSARAIERLTNLLRPSLSGDRLILKAGPDNFKKVLSFSPFDATRKGNVFRYLKRFVVVAGGGAFPSGSGSGRTTARLRLAAPAPPNFAHYPQNIWPRPDTPEASVARAFIQTAADRNFEVHSAWSLRPATVAFLRHALSNGVLCTFYMHPQLQAAVVRLNYDPRHGLIELRNRQIRPSAQLFSRAVGLVFLKLESADGVENSWVLSISAGYNEIRAKINITFDRPLSNSRNAVANVLASNLAINAQ